MRAILFYTFFHFFYSSTVNADSRTFEVDWYCPQTESTTIPTRKTLTFSYETTTGVVDPKELKTILDEALKLYPNLDFFECAKNLADTVTDKLNDYCENKTITSRDFCKSLLPNEVTQIAYIYGKRSLLSGIPVFEPAGNQTLNLPHVHSLNWFLDQAEINSSSLLDHAALTQLKNIKPLLTSEMRLKLSTSYARLLLSVQVSIENIKAADRALVKNSGQRIASTCLTLELLSSAGLTPYLSRNDPQSCYQSWPRIRKKLANFVYDSEITHKPCVTLRPNESVRISGNYGTGIFTNYTLARRSDRRLSENFPAIDPLDGSRLWILKGLRVPVYNVALNFQFIDNSGKIHPNAFEFEKKVRECFAKVNPWLRGPSGAFLELHLYKDTPDVLEPPIIRVDISATTSRATSMSWPSNIECATLIHETMHHLGLPDGYRELNIGALEESSGNVRFVQTNASHPAYNCRSIAPKNSIMHFHDDAFDATTDKIFWNLLTKTPDRLNLLYSAEFNSIIEPGCVSKNRTYYLCASQSKTTSRSSYGSGCKSDLPPECRDGTWVEAPLFTE